MANCKAENCQNNRFGGGYCISHQYLRTDKKIKGLKKVGTKTKTKLKNYEAVKENDLNFYMEIWQERAHVCELTGLFLGNEPLKTMFHHILPKSKYPQYRHTKKNIIVLHPMVHDNVEMNMKKYPKMVEIHAEILKLHEEGRL